MSTTQIQRAKRLEGRVAAILNARELVINIGRSEGVEDGEEFAVLAAEPIRIIDPQTKEELDVFDREKVRVRASEVRDRVTICRTYRLRGVGIPLPRVSDLIGGETPETLRVSDNSALSPLRQDESYVKVNDRVVSVRGE